MTPSRLPYGRQWVEEDDREAVNQVLGSDWLTLGPELEAFERDFAAQCEVDHAVAVSNGTAALHLACLAAGLKPGETLITTPITFLASANCGIYCGADVAFADIDPARPLLSATAVERTLEKLEAAGAKPKVLIPVHYAGLCCDMEALAEVAQRHGLTIIEDACHALGARWQDRSATSRPVGSCSHSAFSTFSFHPVKHITTCEGGMITTNSAEAANTLRSLRSHGMHRPAVTAETGRWVYTMEEPGFNYRLTEIQCALGRSQLRKLPRWVERRRQIMEQYQAALSQLPWCSLLTEPRGQTASYHLAVLILRSSPLHRESGGLPQKQLEAVGQKRRKLYDFFNAKGVGVQVHYIPIYRQPYYRRRFGFEPSDFPNSEAFYASCLSLPLFPRMTDADVRRVIDTLREAGQTLELDTFQD